MSKRVIRIDNEGGWSMPLEANKVVVRKAIEAINKQELSLEVAFMDTGYLKTTIDDQISKQKEQ